MTHTLKFGKCIRKSRPPSGRRRRWTSRRTSAIGPPSATACATSSPTSSPSSPPPTTSSQKTPPIASPKKSNSHCAIFACVSCTYLLQEVRVNVEAHLLQRTHLRDIRLYSLLRKKLSEERVREIERDFVCGGRGTMGQRMLCCQVSFSAFECQGSDTTTFVKECG